MHCSMSDGRDCHPVLVGFVEMGVGGCEARKL